MECSNELIAALLSDYVSGHLASDEEDNVRAHIAECPVCRDSLRTIGLMTPQGNPALKSHPAKDVLSLYYHDRDQLAPLIAEMVHEHLSHCQECSAELAILDDMERELRGSVSGATTSQGQKSRLMSQYGRYVAYAAAACLLLMVGYRVMVTEDQSGSTSVTYRLSESVRSGSAVSEVRRTTATENLVFEVPFYHARDENDYSAHIADAQGQMQIANAERIEFPEKGMLSIRVPSAKLNDGDYQLIVRESKRGTAGEATQSYYPFRLSTHD